MVNINAYKLAHDLMSLQFYRAINIAGKLDLLKDTDRNLGHMEVYERIVECARKDDKLQELQEEVLKV